jgi:hypothetical protein
MAKRLVAMLGAVLMGGMAGLGVPSVSAQALRAPTDVESSHEMVEAPVLKVFSAKEGKHEFMAYLVKWKDSEVIVSDPLARSRFRIGDEISFMVQKATVGSRDHRAHLLSFMLLPSQDAVSPAEQKRWMRLAGGDLDAAENEVERLFALGPAAKNALRKGETEKARTLAKELERLTPKYKDWDSGNEVQDANQVLGRIALAEGDVAEAKKRLLASADSKGSPQMNSFGPNMQLAKELLAKGEKVVVIEYFKRCGTFWKRDRGRLATWTEAVRKGKTPDFGANLKY